MVEESPALDTGHGAFDPLERRKRKRYPFQSLVRYKLPNGGMVTGATVDVSSKGVLFAVPDPPFVGQSLELRCYWPVERADGIPLELVIWGRVIRREAGRAAVAIERYELRALGEPRLRGELLSHP